MPEPAAVAIANFAAEYFAADAIAVYVTATEVIPFVIAATSVYTLREQARKQANSARDAYNASLQDRYVMVRGAATPRQVVLGRQRVSGPIAFLQSYGADRQSLVFLVLLAAHEIDAVEGVYINDELAELDGSNNVVSVQRREQFAMTGSTGTFTLSGDAQAGAPSTAWVDYGSTRVALTITSFVNRTVSVSGGTAGLTGTVTIQYRPYPNPWTNSAASTDLQALLAINGSGAGSVTLPSVPTAGSVFVTWSTGSGQDRIDHDLTSLATVAGATVSVSGASADTFGTNATVTYRSSTAPSSRMRITAYLGGAGQTADAGIISNLPGVWTSAHTLAGQAYLKVECDYSPDAFPNGLPNISAVVRGAKVYDPRTGTTAWSENPALLARYAATSTLLGRMPTSMVNDTNVAAQANVCDASVTYTVNGQAYTRAKYTAGTVVKSGTQAKQVLDDLCGAMAGRWVIVDGMLRLRAGGAVTALQTLDENWLAGGQAVQVQAKVARADLFNAATGKFVDQQRDYIELDYPLVGGAGTAYATEDGAELPLEIKLPCVTFVGQAQQVVATMMRDARQGIHVTLTCNMRAYAVEVFDVINVTISRFGWSSKPFEVLDVSWTLDGGITLQLKETSSTIWDMGTSFNATDPAPNTLLPSPWYVPNVTGLSCSSGTAQLQRQADGTIVSTVAVTWTAITDRYVTESGGGVEVLYGLSTTPQSQWLSVLCPNGAGAVRLVGVRDGALYLVKARAYTALAKGAWCQPTLHKVIGKTAPPANVTGFGGAVSKGRIVWVWDADKELDYGTTEIRATDADWGSSTVAPLFRGPVTQWPEVVSTTGTRTRYARHIDTSGNASASTVSAAVAVAAADLTQDGAPGLSNALVYAYQRSASGAPALPSATVTYTFAGGALSGLNNGWSATPPAGTDPLYVTVATASSAASTDTIAAGEWAAAQLLAASGAPGANGVNSAIVFLFQRTSSATPPAAPSGTVTYTFSSGVASGLDGGWSQSMPTTGGAYRWVTTATALSAAATDTIASGEWAAVSLLTQDGANGSNGANTATVYLFQRTGSSTPPGTPSGTVTYTFASGGASGVGAWSQTLGSTGGSYRWLTTAVASSNATTDTIAPAEWAAPVLISDATGALAALDQVDTAQIAAGAATVVQSSFLAGPVYLSSSS